MARIRLNGLKNEKAAQGDPARLCKATDSLVRQRSLCHLKLTAYDQWHDRERPADDAVTIRNELRDSELVSHIVGRQVGNRCTKGAQLIEPV